MAELPEEYQNEAIDSLSIISIYQLTCILKLLLIIIDYEPINIIPEEGVGEACAVQMDEGQLIKIPFPSVRLLIWKLIPILFVCAEHKMSV